MLRTHPCCIVIKHLTIISEFFISITLLEVVIVCSCASLSNSAFYSRLDDLKLIMVDI